MSSVLLLAGFSFGGYAVITALAFGSVHAVFNCQRICHFRDHRGVLDTSLRGYIHLIQKGDNGKLTRLAERQRSRLNKGTRTMARKGFQSRHQLMKRGEKNCCFITGGKTAD